jgi:hypothetical protein
VTATDSAGNQSEDAVIDASMASVGDPKGPPGFYALAAGSPNPFVTTTTIAFGLPEGGATKLTVFDVNGRHVITLLDEELPAGRYSMCWSGRDEHKERVSTGIYFAVLQSRSFAATSKIVHIR